MKRVSLFGANFEDSKKIVTSGKYSLTAGMPNPIHMSLLNRLFTVGFCMFIFFGVIGYFITIAMPSSIGLEGEVYYISYASTVLIRSMAAFLKPVSLLFYLTYLFASIPVFWPKKRLSSQVFTYFPLYFPWVSSAFLAVFYLASAVAYDANTLLGFWLQLIVGIALFIWIIVNKIQNLKRRLNDEDEKELLKKVLLIALGIMVLLFPISLVYHLVNKLPILWYSYLLSPLLTVSFVIYAYLVAFLIDVHIVQAYYIHKYPMEYKEYLEISDREWYSKSYYKKLVKSGQLEEEEWDMNRQSEALNKEYFQALGSTRASVRMLSLAWAGLFVLSIDLTHVYFFIKEQFTVDPFSNVPFLFLCLLLLLMLGCQIMSFSKTFIYKHQLFSTAMLFVLINGIHLSLVLMDYILTILTNEVLKNSLIYSLIYWLSSIGLFMGLIVYNASWLKKQLRKGFSEKRTTANYIAFSGVYSKPSLWIILGVTLLGGGLASLSGYYLQTFGIVSNIVFISAFSRLIVEVGYLLYLRSKDKTYWEEVPKETKSQSFLKTIDLKKAKYRLVIEIVLFLTLAVCLKILKINVENSPIWLIWTIRTFGYSILLDTTISFIYYQIKKKR